jgi:hypothetical protein
MKQIGSRCEVAESVPEVSGFRPPNEASDRECLGGEFVVSGFCNITDAMEDVCEFGIDVAKDRLSVFSTESDREADPKS